MKRKFKRQLSLILAFTMMVQLLTGCSGKGDSPPASKDVFPESVVQEERVFEVHIAEEKLQESYIIEHLVYEEGIYEYVVSEDIISEAYIIEVVVGEVTEEQILAQLPAEIEEYDINWPKVIGKFAVGTTIIITVGIVNHVSNGSTYFLFGTPASVATDAIIGGAIGAALNEVIGCLKNGKMPAKGVTKYAIEGFAEGYMWGAISSVTKIASENFKRLKAFKLASGGKATIKPDGRVYDEAGKLIGRAFYEKKGLWYLSDDASRVVQVFDKAGKAVTDPAVITTLKLLPPNAMLRLGTAAKAVICYTDDLGQVIRTGNVLAPNICYQMSGYTYYTDDLGRISKVIFEDLKLKPEGLLQLRIPDSKNVIGKGFEQFTDDRGHLIADMFGGNNTMANIVAMEMSVNRSGVKAIELGWRSCLKSGGHVQGSIELTYSGKSFRPDNFKYVYDMGEGLVETLISNIL